MEDKRIKPLPVHQIEEDQRAYDKMRQENKNTRVTASLLQKSTEKLDSRRREGELFNYVQQLELKIDSLEKEVSQLRSEVHTLTRRLEGCSETSLTSTEHQPRGVFK